MAGLNGDVKEQCLPSSDTHAHARRRRHARENAGSSLSSWSKTAGAPGGRAAQLAVHPIESLTPHDMTLISFFFLEKIRMKWKIRDEKRHKIPACGLSHVIDHE